MKKFMLLVLSLSLIVTGLIGPLSQAKANEIEVNDENVMSTDEEILEDSSYTDEELEQIENIEKELQYYFEEVGELTDAGYVIHDREAVQEKADNGDESAQRVLELVPEVAEPGAITTYSAGTFGTCVVNKFIDSYGTIARAWTTGLVYSYIQNRQYDLAAKIMFKTLTKAGRTANVASIAIEAGIYGYQCRGSW